MVVTAPLSPAGGSADTPGRHREAANAAGCAGWGDRCAGPKVECWRRCSRSAARALARRRRVARTGCPPLSSKEPRGRQREHLPPRPLQRVAPAVSDHLLSAHRVARAAPVRRPRASAGRRRVLLVANHVSHIDPVYDAVFVRKAGAGPHFMAKASLWKVPVLGTVMRGTDQIPVERAGGGAGKQSLDAAEAALRAGKVVLIYPEGTITRDPDTWPMRPEGGRRPARPLRGLPGRPDGQLGHRRRSSCPTSRRAGSSRCPARTSIVQAGPPIDLSRLPRQAGRRPAAPRRVDGDHGGGPRPGRRGARRTTADEVLRAEACRGRSPTPSPTRSSETVAETAADPVTEPDAEGSAAQ